MFPFVAKLADGKLLKIEISVEVSALLQMTIEYNSCNIIQNKKKTTKKR